MIPRPSVAGEFDRMCLSCVEPARQARSALCPARFDRPERDSGSGRAGTWRDLARKTSGRNARSVIEGRQGAIRREPGVVGTASSAQCSWESGEGARGGMAELRGREIKQGLSTVAAKFYRRPRRKRRRHLHSRPIVRAELMGQMISLIESNSAADLASNTSASTAR